MSDAQSPENTLSATETASTTHLPVLLAETIQALSIRPDGTYLDATFGRGGHCRAMLAELSAAGRVIAIDRDPQAIAIAEALQAHESRLTVVRARFGALGDVIDRCGVTGAVDGALMDVGVSSPQLDDARRGFSFRHDGPLDMRMDPQHGVSAAGWLNSAAEQDIADVIWRYGEERRSRRIAKAIITARPLHRTQELAELVASCVPHVKRSRQQASKHPATKTFQAIRIFINDELQELKQGLQVAFENLTKGGRLAVISFHSLEDREVKRAFKALSQPPVMPRRLPVRAANVAVPGRLVGGAIRAGNHELQTNPRARSATLRVIERVA